MSMQLVTPSGAAIPGTALCPRHYAMPGRRNYSESYAEDTAGTIGTWTPAPGVPCVDCSDGYDALDGAPME